MANVTLSKNDAGGIVVDTVSNSGNDTKKADFVTTEDLAAPTGASMVGTADAGDNLVPAGFWNTHNLQGTLDSIADIIQFEIFQNAFTYLHIGQSSFPRNVNATLKMPADQLAGPTSLQTFYLPRASDPGTYTVTLSTTNAVNGNRIMVVRPLPVATGVIYNIVDGGPGSAILISLPFSAIAGGEALVFQFNGTNWAYARNSDWVGFGGGTGNDWDNW